MGLILWVFLFFTAWAHGENGPLYITDVKITANGQVLMTCKGDHSLRLYDPTGTQLIKSWKLQLSPTGVATWDDKALVTCFDGKGEIVLIDLSSEAAIWTQPAASGATAPLMNEEHTKAYVCNQFAGTVSEIDVETGKVIREVKVLREPKGAIVSADGNTLYVTNFLPFQRADLDYVAACLSVIDVKTFE